MLFPRRPLCPRKEVEASLRGEFDVLVTGGLGAIERRVHALLALLSALMDIVFFFESPQVSDRVWFRPGVCGSGGADFAAAGNGPFHSRRSPLIKFNRRRLLSKKISLARRHVHHNIQLH
jgi:hypothetical protein